VEQNFRRALARLASNRNYARQASRDPEVIERDFALTNDELDALRQVAVLSGVDTTEVDRVRRRHGPPDAQAEEVPVEIDVSCCCCCCCGETAVLAIPAGSTTQA
jgi:hypothetical protein